MISATTAFETRDPGGEPDPPSQEARINLTCKDDPDGMDVSWATAELEPATFCGVYFGAHLRFVCYEDGLPHSAHAYVPAPPARRRITGAHSTEK